MLLHYINDHVTNRLYVTFTVYTGDSARPDCSDQKERAANLCSDKLFFAGKNSRLYPENEVELDQHCKETTELVRCVAQYTDNCPRGVHRPTANVMLSTVRHNQRTYCNRASKRRDLIALGTCGNAIRTLSSKCFDTFLMDMGRASHSRRPHKVPHGCW